VPADIPNYHPSREARYQTRAAPQDFCVFTDTFKLSFLMAAVFIAYASAFMYILLRLPNLEQHPSCIMSALCSELH